MNLYNYSYQTILPSLLLFLMVLVFPQPVFSQGKSTTVDEVLISASKAISNNDFEEAIAILKPYEKNSYVLQLLAQSYYWNGNIQKAKEIYRKAITDYPGKFDIQLDYGRMLYELGESDAAEKVLYQYLKTQPNNVEAHLNLGYINFQKGNYHQSENHFRSISERYPDNLESKKMLESINELRSWQIGIGNTYFTDDQPLQSQNPFLNVQKFQNPFFQPELKVKLSFFNSDTVDLQTKQIEIGNTFSFLKSQMKIRTSLGLILDHVDGKNHWLGDVSLNKKLSNKLSLIAGWNRHSLFYTLSSLSNVVTTDDYSLDIKLEDGDGWLGQAGINYSRYFDDNSIVSPYLWILSPAWGPGNSKWRIGYAGSYSNAEELRYSSKITLDEILQNFEEGMEISGKYTPYFTPQNQIIHSIIGLAEIQFSHALFLKLNANVGLFASADIPYLYLDNTPEGLGLVQEVFREKTTNIQFEAELNYKISNNISLNTNYQYFENFFYEANTIQIKLNLLL